MSRRVALVVDAGSAGERLDRFLAAALPAAGEPVSRRLARRLIGRGAVYLDGHRVRVASRAVAAGARVEVELPDDGGVPAAPTFELEPARVLYRDDDLIAVDKPAGLPAQATVDDAVDNLEAAVRRFLARERPAPYLALHHRLDRGTSGVMLFALARRANRELARVFSEGEVEKVYRARVHASPGVEIPNVAETGEGRPGVASWTVANRLDRRHDERGRWRMAAVAAGGREAVTDFSVLERDAGTALVEARPRTGRTHQIRVHLADAGLPVVGDRRYGPRAPATRLMLHAFRLALPHPVTGAPLVVESPLPPGF